ncbi:Acyl-coenzyme A thioesterase PaaI, contains HGG motif [Jatrophihabitans endophyticus]|uniref:Acyl-coenzyme A thioesterase PaaI, contains HGG motif n=1 Tax=Jatrophihabitans endophyticus TaxID=1206085 RepID=A0A1M5PU13_9ACTN|nr:PaaI family thioesterase [Jatrophihabitans endophyticus]SHH05467.1 Acyl-coenzyme A thioesterase PaaI, contains HGG motif [Jatrophihabitans endophyticus]
MDEPSIQQRFFPDLPCFGCGPANAKGLRLRSVDAGDGVVSAEFLPWPEHDNGLGYLNGGIIATLLDCHGAAAVALASERLGLPADGTLRFVTAGLDVRYLRPSPLTEPVGLVGHAVEVDAEQMTIATELRWQDKPRATATAVWKRWHPRSAGAGPRTH